MGPEDLPLVEAIEQDGQDAPWSHRIFRDCLDVGYDCRMVLEDDQRIGFVIVSRVLDEAHLLNIVLHRDWRGLGIAAEVLSTVMEELRHDGIGLLYLEVRESNTPARRLYEKLGFRSNGFRQNYYRTATGDREDAILMSRPLAPDHK